MTDLSFTVDSWLERDHGTPEERRTFAQLEIHAGGICLTEVEDRAAKTTRSSVRVSLFHLADWLLWNRWRLLYEPEARNESSWRHAHEVGAAGGGFLWPQLTFTSDGETVTARQTADSPHNGMVRYLNHAEIPVPLARFERATDALIAQVVDRLSALGLQNGHLTGLLRLVQEERADTFQTALRRDEALLGLDPDEVDPESVIALRAHAHWAGPRATDELLVEARFAQAKQNLNWAQVQLSHPEQTLDLSELDRFTINSPLAGAPWERGVALATTVREGLGLALEPVDLDALVHTKLDRTWCSSGVAPFGLGFIPDGTLRRVGCTLQKRGMSARFAVARVIGDALQRPADDRVLPITSRATARQKVQRAFAQELLCPIDGLAQRVSLPHPTDDELESAADYYGVSEYTVRTALVNRGLVAREYLPQRW